jgi:CheY-like chemotaxis protein
MIPFTAAETILVVDDEWAIREVIEVILIRAGYRVLTAGDGAEALRMARDTPGIALLVSDLEMPRMRGDALATRFSRLHPSASVLFVSSSNGPIETTVPFTFLGKPFTLAQLRDAVRGALRSRPALAEVSQAA